jgi:cyclopropane fatty-acyl-phospholipid synthase-like methyltransferase
MGFGIWPWVVLVLIIGAGSSILIPSFFGGAWSPTPMKIIKRMVELSELKPEEVLYDLGAGDGRVICYVAKQGIKAVGVELDPIKVFFIRVRLFLKKLPSAEVKKGNFFNMDLSPADVVFTYLSPASMKRFQEKFLKELRPGARVVSYRRSIPGWKEWKKEGEIYLYIQPFGDRNKESC